LSFYIESLYFQLAVIIASLARGHASLSIGYIVGTAVVNIIGSFSLGLLFHAKGKPIQFDRSSRVYSLVLVLLTTFVVPIIHFRRKVIWLSCGAILIVLFTVYIGLAGWAISKGILTSPEHSEIDSSNDVEGSGNSKNNTERTQCVSEDTALPLDPTESSSGTVAPQGISPPVRGPSPPASRSPQRPRALHYHIFYFIFGFLAIGLSGYVLSHAATTITDELKISEVSFGVVILAIATTLPKKLIAVLSGRRRHFGIIVANTAGNDVFLLTLCAGIVMLQSSNKIKESSPNVMVTDLGLLWGSTVAFALTVWFGGRFPKWIGAVMVLGYITFVVLEFIITGD
jgi:Ca2+/Na+ antiporter